MGSEAAATDQLLAANPSASSEMDFSSVDAAAFKAGMRCLSSGVVIITSGTGDERRGLTATAVCSLSAEPPSLIACVNRAAEAHDIIHRTGSFAINILGQEHVPLAALFAGRDGLKGKIRFETGSWTTLKTGVPILADAIATFDCRVLCAHDSGSHTLFVGLVIDAKSRLGDPLIYSHRGFASLRRASSGRSTRR